MPVTALIDVETPVYDPRTGASRSHLVWARTIARAVRADYHFGEGSQEELDLEQVAATELVRRVADFDPGRVPERGDLDMAFRGWCQRAIKTACQREALRLRNGGTYHTTRTPGAPVAGLPADVAADVPSAEIEIGDVRCRLTGSELTVECVPDIGAWAVAVGQLDAQRERSLWLLGDLVLYGVERFGADAWDALASMGYANQSVKQARWVCAKFPSVSRLTMLSFGHHAAVSRLPLDRALALLRRAVREKLTRRQLRDIVCVQSDAPRERQPLTRAEQSRLPEVAQRHGVDPAVVLAILKELRP